MARNKLVDMIGKLSEEQVDEAFVPESFTLPGRFGTFTR